MKLKRIFKISIINTIRMNFHYFGIKGIIHPYILASRNLKISKLAGQIDLNKRSKIGSIQIGFLEVGIFDFKYQRSIWQNSGKIRFEGTAILGQGTKICNSGNLTFGNNFTITANSSIICHKKIDIGENVLISWDSIIMDTDFHKIFNKNDPKTQLNQPAAITIGNNVWLGCRTAILKGSIVSDDSVIAAGSTISKAFYDKNIILGNTNSIIKKDIIWTK